MASQIRKRRVHNFEGTEDEYIEFLEQKIHQLEVNVQQLQVEVQHLNQRGGLGGLQLVQPPTPRTPGVLLLQLGTPSQARNARNRCIAPWKSVIHEFSSQVPKNEGEWLARQEQLHLRMLEDVVHTFRLFTRCSRQLRPLGVDDKPDCKASILMVLEDYGIFANKLGGHRAYATQISYYSTLLFFCLSIIALRAGADIEAVDNHLREFLTEQQGQKCDAGAVYLSRLRTGALWPLKRMVELERKGLKHRSAELFVLCMQHTQSNRWPINSLLHQVHAIQRHKEFHKRSYGLRTA